MNGRYERRDDKKVKALNFISGGYKKDDALVSQNENETQYPKEIKDSNNRSADVVVIDSQVAGSSNSGSHKQGDKEAKDYAGWEKHNKGIGSKLLKKMGHEEGKGLGKSAQGITLPLEAFRRLGRGTIGSYGSETKENHAQVENKYKNKPWLRDMENNRDDNMNRDNNRDNNKGWDQINMNMRDPHEHKNKPWMKYKLRQIERSKHQRGQPNKYKKYVDLTARVSKDNYHRERHPTNKSNNHPNIHSDMQRAVCRDQNVDMFSSSPTNSVDVVLVHAEIIIDADEEDRTDSIAHKIMQTANLNKRKREAMEEEMNKMAKQHDRLLKECRMDDIQVSSISLLNLKANQIVDLSFKHSSMTSDDVTVIETSLPSSSLSLLPPPPSSSLPLPSSSSSLPLPSSPLNPTITDTLETCIKTMQSLQQNNNNSNNNNNSTSDNCINNKNDNCNNDPLFETISFLHPTFINIFKDWDPLQNSDHGFELINELKYLITTYAFITDDSKKDEITSKRLKIFDALISEHIINKLREAIQAWSITKPQIMIDLMDKWSPLMEKRTLNQLYNIIFNVKMRKGLREIDNSSKSLSDAILPWVFVLGKRIRSLPKHILNKIGFFADAEVLEVLSGED